MENQQVLNAIDRLKSQKSIYNNNLSNFKKSLVELRTKLEKFDIELKQSKARLDEITTVDAVSTDNVISMFGGFSERRAS